jgi:hypothetical protein
LEPLDHEDPVVGRRGEVEPGLLVEQQHARSVGRDHLEHPSRKAVQDVLDREIADQRPREFGEYRG